MPKKTRKTIDEAVKTESSHQRAALYIRVSSTGQLGRAGDDDGDGYSIPAQIAACERKAADLEAEVAKAYVERAESARSDDRPVLQYMLAELQELGITHLIVHKVDRLARNRLDDATLYQQLVGMGITLVSASENIDATPAGRLMHGMLATFAEYYSNNLASEIKKGLHQKHLKGGTPFKPPIGYLPKRNLVGNQDMRWVEEDADRAPLVREAFSLYATGDWPLHRLTDYLDAAGLRSRETPKRGPMPLRMTSVHKMLKNIYYVGIVEYRGVRVVGTHPRLIDDDTFDRVQEVLAAHAIAGDRPSKHEHFLRGSLYCAECGGRLLYGEHRGKLGVLYPYFCCINRQTRNTGGSCQSRHYRVAEIERKVETLYRTLHLPEVVRDQVWDELRQDAGLRGGVVRQEIERHKRKLTKLEDNQARLVQMAYSELVSEEVLAREQARIVAEKKQITRLLKEAESHLHDVEDAAEAALRQTATPHATYQASTLMERRLLNQTFFKRILVGDEGEITETELTPIYDALSSWHPTLGHPGTTTPGGGSTRVPTSGTSRENPDPDDSGQGSLLNSMVETAGIEPASAVA
ncbi:MAG TPA: recombinase family protein [Solirubrobacteraceae bacterium]|nr:recombinase family protein [Solirubrobacteraceae bacterium]